MKSPRDKRKGPTGSMGFPDFYDTSKPRRSVGYPHIARRKRSFDHEGGRVVMTVYKEKENTPLRVTGLSISTSLDRAALEAVEESSRRYHRGSVMFHVYGDKERVALAASLRWAADILDPHQTEVQEKPVTGGDVY